jgi:LysM repeat protein
MRFLPACLFVLSACAHQQVQPLVPEVGGMEGGETSPPGTWHPVIAGETLWRVAHHYGVTVNLLIKTNAIGDPTELRVGHRLFIPLAPGSDFDERQAKVAARPSVIALPMGPDLAPDGGFAFPLPGGKVIKAFGRRGDEVSDGINIAHDLGAEVLATAPGKVVFSAEDAGWGHLIILAHAGQWVSIYGHNSASLVTEGQQVARGQPIAKVGASGRVDKPQLHFELRRGVLPRDPAQLLPPRKDLQRR